MRISQKWFKLPVIHWNDCRFMIHSESRAVIRFEFGRAGGHLDISMSHCTIPTERCVHSSGRISFLSSSPLSLVMRHPPSSVVSHSPSKQWSKEIYLFRWIDCQTLARKASSSGEDQGFNFKGSSAMFVGHQQSTFAGLELVINLTSFRLDTRQVVVSYTRFWHF